MLDTFVCTTHYLMPSITYLNCIACCPFQIWTASRRPVKLLHKIAYDLMRKHGILKYQATRRELMKQQQQVGELVPDCRSILLHFFVAYLPAVIPPLLQEASKAVVVETPAPPPQPAPAPAAAPVILSPVNAQPQQPQRHVVV